MADILPPRPLLERYGDETQFIDADPRRDRELSTGRQAYGVPESYTTTAAVGALKSANCGLEGSFTT